MLKIVPSCQYPFYFKSLKSVGRKMAIKTVGKLACDCFVTNTQFYYIHYYLTISDGTLGGLAQNPSPVLWFLTTANSSPILFF